MTTATLPTGTGIVSTYGYDNADRLTSISHVKGGSTTIASVAYALDDVGNRTQRVDQQGTHSYVYDDLHRLTSVTYPGPSTTTYDFDAFGNRTQMTVGAASTTYAYDDADRLTSVTPPSPASAVNYTWDDNGNLTARGSDSFSWDYEDRMTSATVNSVTTNFVYRGDGLRNSRTTGITTTQFTWDIASGLPVVLDDGNQYVYAAGLTSMKQGGSWYYYLADGLGSTMDVVDSSGVSQKSYTYDVYGEATPTGGLSNEFDFAGQQTDSTGLQYLRARYYDPESGVFLSRDPLALSEKWLGNGHGYTGGNPILFSDPSGLCRTSGIFPCIPSCLFFDCPDSDDGLSVIGTVGSGAITLVKLSGEYSLEFGENVGEFLMENQGAIDIVLGALLSAAWAACILGGAETAGIACGPVATLMGVGVAWHVAKWIGSDDKSALERVVGTIVSLADAVPIAGKLGKAAEVFQNIVVSLEPKEVN
jgi:RHS repeat-associated protein